MKIKNIEHSQRLDFNKQCCTVGTQDQIVEKEYSGD